MTVGRNPFAWPVVLGNQPPPQDGDRWVLANSPCRTRQSETTVRVITRIVEAAMQKKLTITIDDGVYHGLHTVVGRRRISQFIESLVRPHVIGRD